MPLRDISELQAWVEREAPSAVAQRAARMYIAELGDQPWKAPSVPLAEISNQPEYEVRTVTLDVEGEHHGMPWRSGNTVS